MAQNFRGILSTGEVGNLGLKNQRETRELITEKWESFGLLDGLDGYIKENIATLFENQASQMLNETTSDSSGSFETVAFPVIRRVFSKLLANEIVSVQAMNLPVGRCYFYNPIISQRNSDGSQTTPDGAYSNAAGLWTTDANGRKFLKTGGTQFETFSLYDAFYADYVDSYGSQSLFDRTNGKIYTFTPVVSGGSLTIGTTLSFPVYVTGFSITNTGLLVGPIGVPMDTEEFLASLKITSNVTLTNSVDSTQNIPAGYELKWNLTPQSYSKAIVDQNGNLKVVLDLSTPDSSGGYTLALSAATTPVFSAYYVTYSDLEEDSAMAEVSFDLNFVTVDVGGPKKLRATFTPEIAQDAAAFHSINVEAELTALLSETVATEIDRTILRELRNGAAWYARWNYNGFKYRTGITRQDYNQELIILINQISAAIQKATLRGGANWIVVSPEIAAIFNSLEYFHVSDASPEETKFSMGVEKIGALSSRYSVYVDVYAPANTILIGHKGDSLLFSGYIYAPYVPLLLTPKMMNFNDGRSSFIVSSRFATKMINNKFYGKIYVDGIQSYANGIQLRQGF
jgi:hypothetical protein